jgi:large subunit ribosomal protein L9
MGKELEVIFTEDKKGYFRIGQKKNVPLGYARNFLFPRNLAVLVTPQNEQRITSIEKKAQTHLANLKKTALELKEKLDNQVLTLEHKVHDEGKLYGSVAASDIASELSRNFEVTIDKHDIKLAAPIRELGEYSIAITVHQEVSIQVKVIVKEEEEKKEEKKVSKSKKRSKKDDEAEEVAPPKKRSKPRKEEDDE